MSRGDQLYRQWTILSQLSRGRRSRRELAEELEVTRKTITRDIEALALFPIDETREGIDVYYQLYAGARLPRVRLESEEILALLMVRKTAVRALEGTPLQAPFEAALDRVSSMLGAATRRSKAHLPDVFFSAFARPTLSPELPEHLQEVLIDAATHHRKIWMRYLTASRNSVNERTVEPYTLYLHPNGYTLIAWCLLRGAFLTFSLNQIQAMRVLDETFQPRPFDLDAYLAKGFNGFRSLPIWDVHLRITGPMAHLARNQFFHPTQVLTEIPGGIELTFRCGGEGAVTSRVLSLGPGCQILAPQKLRDDVARLAREIAAVHEAPPE